MRLISSALRLGYASALLLWATFALAQTDWTKPSIIPVPAGTNITTNVPSGVGAVTLYTMGAIGTWQVNLPPAPENGVVVALSCTFTVTAITLATYDRSTFPVVTSCAANQYIPLQYSHASNSWVQVAVNGNPGGGSATLPWISPTTFGAVCDGNTDDSAAIGAALAAAAPGQTVLFPSTQCFSSTGITIPAGITVDLGGFIPGNPVKGGGIICAANTAACVTLGASSSNGTVTIRNGVVSRQGTPTSGTIGIRVYGYHDVINNVVSDNSDQCYSFVADLIARAGIHAEVFGGSAQRCSDVFVDVNSFPEVQWFGGRLGANGTGDYNSNTYVRTEGGLSGTSGGPNTVQFIGVQFNTGGAGDVQHFWEFVRLGTGGVPGIDATNFRVIGGHIEGVKGADFYSDSTWNTIDRVAISDVTINNPSHPMFALNAVARVAEWDISNVLMYVSDLTLAPSSFDSFHITGGRITGTMHLTGTTGSIASIANLEHNANFTLDGVWTQFNGFGESYSGGSSFINSATGNVTVDNVISGRTSTGVVNAPQTISATSGQALAKVNAVSGSDVAATSYQSAGTPKWQIGNNGTNQLRVWDQANASTAWLTVTTGGNATIGENSGNVLTVNGKIVADQFQGGSVTLPAVLDAHSYGAKCDGNTDDTTALQAWAAAAATNVNLTLSGNCVFKTAPLLFSGSSGNIKNVTIMGPGMLTYSGSNTSTDLVEIGDPADATQCVINGWTVKDLRINSTTVMTGGDALNVSHSCQSNISNLRLGEFTGNLWRGLEINVAGYLRLHGMHVQGAADTGEYLHGNASYILSDMWQDQVQIGGSRIGLNIAGRVVLTYASGELFSNGTSIKVTRDAVTGATQKQGIYLGPGLFVDANDITKTPSWNATVTGIAGQVLSLSTVSSNIAFLDPVYDVTTSKNIGVVSSWDSGSVTLRAAALNTVTTGDTLRIGAFGRGIWVTDPADAASSARSHIVMTGTHISFASDQNILIDPAAQTWDIRQTGGTMYFCQCVNGEAALENYSTNGNMDIQFTGTMITNNIYQDLFNVTGAKPIQLSGVRFDANPANITGSWYGDYISSAGLVTYGKSISTSGDRDLESSIANFTDTTSGNTFSFKPEQPTGLMQLCYGNGGCTGGINVPGTVQTPQVNITQSARLSVGKNVSDLPTCDTTTGGTLYYVLDAVAPAYNTALTGGGTIRALAMCNGTAWVAH